MIKNYAEINGLTYQICLAFYDEDNRLISVNSHDARLIENKISRDNLEDILPAGTSTVKAVVWSNLTQMISLTQPDILSK